MSVDTSPSDLIAELRAGLDKATKGRWHEGAGWVFVDPIDAERNPSHALRSILRDVDEDELQANVAHIVTAQPDNIRTLLDHIAALEARVAKAEAAIIGLIGEDGPIENLLFGDFPDDKSITITAPLSAFRAARLASKGRTE